jgi:hypothetical protein
LDNGTILAEKITPFPQDPPDEELCLEESPSPCHPLLVMLAEHFEKPYAQLEKLQQEGLGIGEIARLLTLEQASTHTLESLIAERQAGKDWAAILRAYPEIMPEALQITISLENT